MSKILRQGRNRLMLNQAIDALQVFQRENPERELELEADRGVTLEQLFMIWDALTKAGIEIKNVPARIKLPAAGGEPFVDPLQP